MIAMIRNSKLLFLKYPKKANIVDKIDRVIKTGTVHLIVDNFFINIGFDSVCGWSIKNKNKYNKKI